MDCILRYSYEFIKGFVYNRGVWGFEISSDEVLGKAESILKDIPLCDRCLGRMFARLGFGFSNRDRGLAIKRILVMLFYEAILRGDTSRLEEFKSIAPNIGSEALESYRRLFNSTFEAPQCFICRGLIDKFIDDVSFRGLKLLMHYGVRRFLVGVRVDKNILEAEENLVLKYNLKYSESIKREIKREIGKSIQAKSSLTVDFINPEAVLIVEFPSSNIELTIASIIVKGRYWKTGRLISQAYWPTIGGPKYYSIEEALHSITKLMGAESIVIHAAGREDVDARMLGSGRPLILEVKAPRNRNVDFRVLEESVRSNSNGLIEISLEDYTRRELIRVYKEESKIKTKVYKTLILVEDTIGDNDIKLLEETFKNSTILQKTPLRVLHRRKEATRKRKVHEIKCKAITRNLIECLIKTSGGLYIKELVTGDQGRTKPSITEILNKNAKCIELDVVSVEAP
ncbi:MAG: tRNA pseudouridine(54/55) synthase Pus10 [Acidilobaceae archaeon]